MKPKKSYCHTMGFLEKKLKKLQLALDRHKQMMDKFHRDTLKKDAKKRKWLTDREDAVEDLTHGRPVKDPRLLKWAISALQKHIEIYNEHPETLPTGLTINDVYRALRCGFEVYQDGRVV